MSIRWWEDYEAALQEAKSQRKILFLYFHKTPG